MPIIFNRFSNNDSVQSLEVIHRYLDVDAYHRQIAGYENLVYQNIKESEAVIKASPSSRLQRLSQNIFPLSTLLSASNILLNILDVITSVKDSIKNKYESQKSLGYWFGWFADIDVKSYENAYAGINGLYRSLLSEANVLRQAIAVKLSHWHNSKDDLRLIGKQNHSINSSQESIFNENCKTVIKLNVPINNWYKRIFSKSSALKPLSRSDSNLSDSFERGKNSVSKSLNELGLNDQDYVKYAKQLNSFWKSDQYKARLTFIKVNLHRSIKLSSRNPKPRWQAIQSAIADVSYNLNQLNSLFHRSTKSVYRAYLSQLTESQIQTALEGLSLVFMSENLLESIENNKSIVLAWLRELPAMHQRYWDVVISGLTDPSGINIVDWEQCFRSVCTKLNIGISDQAWLIRRLVTNYIVPAVTSESHVAYPLVTSYSDVRLTEPKKDRVDLTRVIDLSEFNKDQLSVTDRLVESVHKSIDRLSDISQASNSNKLDQLIELNLTREDLKQLIHADISNQTRDLLSTQLKFIAGTAFASKFCQQQARLLTEMISDISSDLKASTATEYLDLMSRRAISNVGKFGSYSPNRKEGAERTERNDSNENKENRQPGNSKYEAK